MGFKITNESTEPKQVVRQHRFNGEPPSVIVLKPGETLHGDMTYEYGELEAVPAPAKTVEEVPPEAPAPAEPEAEEPAP